MQQQCQMNKTMAEPKCIIHPKRLDLEEDNLNLITQVAKIETLFICSSNIKAMTCIASK